jgi:hypothetical protein
MMYNAGAVQITRVSDIIFLPTIGIKRICKSRFTISDVF